MRADFSYNLTEKSINQMGHMAFIFYLYFFYFNFRFIA